MTFGPPNSISSFLPLEQDFPEDNKLFREILAARERATASTVNLKENGSYEKVELLAGQFWFTTNTSGAMRPTYVYRLTFDLVALNGGNIGAGATTLTLSASTIPAAIKIVNSIQPIRGFGAANNGTNFYFINDPLLFVRTNVWTNVSQQIIITNNTGANLTQCVWCFEYFKF